MALVRPAKPDSVAREHGREQTDDTMPHQRQEMVKQIVGETRATGHLTGRFRLDPRVVEAMAKVPRHEFVSPSFADDAYLDSPLAIGCGQSMSQPYIVALMTDLLDLGDEAVVLEVGTGSGYQAAILAEIASRVHSVEVHGELALAAQQRLLRLGYTNVDIYIGDGQFGCESHAPYDGILVAAAVADIPVPLIEQLKVGANLVIPVLTGSCRQELIVVNKDKSGAILRRPVLPVVFVPFQKTGERPVSAAEKAGT